jgi:hypothetical protein
VRALVLHVVLVAVACKAEPSEKRELGQPQPKDKLAELFGRSGFELAFAKDRPLLAATLNEVLHDWADDLCKAADEEPRVRRAIVAMKSDPYGITLERQVTACLDGTDAELVFDHDGKVSSLSVKVTVAPGSEARRGLLAFLDSKYGGSPTTIAEQRGTVRYYVEPASHLRAVVVEASDAVIVNHSRYLPISELIGGDKPGLSIEGVHMPYGLLDEIALDDPRHYVRSGDPARLFYPPTELGNEYTAIELKHYNGEPDTFAYEVDIPYRGHEPTSEHVLALLRAKFGEPTTTRRPDADNRYDTFEKGGRRVETRRFNGVWEIEVRK